MGMLSIVDIMTLPIMKTSKVKTSKNSLEDYMIEWVSVIESPVENFVRENELVLTTGIGCQQDPKLLMEFVKDVVNSGASALAFASGRYIFDIPEEVLDFAESHHFVIIDIPWEIRFGDIIQGVMERLHETQQKEAELSETIQKQLIQMVLNGKSVAELLGYVFNHLQLPTCIIDKKGRLRAAKRLSRDFCYELATYHGNEDFQQKEDTDTATSDSQHPLLRHLIPVQIGSQRLYKMLIHSSGMEQGYLFIQPRSGSEFPDRVRLNILEHAITALALYFLNENTVEETEMRLKDDFVLSLALESGDYGKRLTTRALRLGYDLSVPYLCIIGSFDHTDAYARQSQPAKDQNWQHGLFYYIKEEAFHAAEALERKTMVASYDDIVIIYLESTVDSNKEFVNHFLDLLERRLHNLLPGSIPTWGTGMEADGLKVFYKSYLKAKTALDIGQQQNGVGSRTGYEDTKMNRLLHRLAKISEVHEITTGVLEPLLDYDRKRDMDLMGTFMAYNRNKSNVSQTARELNLHRQSLLYRLRKIETLTELSLLDSDDLFLLELSIRTAFAKETLED